MLHMLTLLVTITILLRVRQLSFRASRLQPVTRVLSRYHLIDYLALNEQITSSLQTPRRSRFREDVMERDGSFCIFTRETAVICEAVHIIPRSNGNEVPFEMFSFTSKPLTRLV